MPTLALMLAREIDVSRRRLRAAAASCRKRMSVRRIHDLRIEARRLQSRIELSCAGSGIATEKKSIRRINALLQLLGPLRDTQVQLKWLGTTPPNRSGLESLRQFLKRRERRLAKRVAKRLKPGRFEARIRKLQLQLPASPDTAAGERRFRDRIGRALLAARRRALAASSKAGTGTKQLHHARIALKRYHLIQELLARLRVGSPVRDPGPPLKDLAVLGEIHDLDVLLARAAKCARRRIIAPGPATLLRDRLQKRRTQLLTARRRRWRKRKITRA